MLPRRLVLAIFLLAVLGLTARISTTDTVLIASGSAWKYHDRGANLGTTWRTRSYVDSAWAAGSAQLGYGDGDEATVVRYGPNSAAKYITTYFRQTFSVADPALVQSLTLKVLRDDGAVVYLNGTEVFRTNMPTGTIAYNTLAPMATADADETTHYTASIDPALLTAGANVLAVEVHQANGSSSDVSFDAELIASTNLQITRRNSLHWMAIEFSSRIRWNLLSIQRLEKATDVRLTSIVSNASLPRENHG